MDMLPHDFMIESFSVSCAHISLLPLQRQRVLSIFVTAVVDTKKWVVVFHILVI